MVCESLLRGNILPSASVFNSTPLSSNNNDALSRERSKISGDSPNSDYNKPLDLKQEEKRKKLPWEI